MGTATGPANLEADWTANTLTIDWYNGDTKLSSNTCTYDGQIILPSTNPEKTGYTFRGWQVRTVRQCSLKDFAATVGAASTSVYGSGRGFIETDPMNDRTAKADVFGLTEKGQWATNFDGGVVKGISICSSTPSNTYNQVVDNVSADKGDYCWCKPTSFTLKENDIIGETCMIISSKWIYAEKDCWNCAWYCANYAKGDHATRVAYKTSLFNNF